MATDWNLVRSLEEQIADIGYGSDKTAQEMADFNTAQRRLQAELNGGGANGQTGNAIDASRKGVSASQQGVDASRQGVEAARQYGQQAIGAGQSGIDAILSGRANVDRAVSDMRMVADAASAGYDTAYDAVRGMDPYIRGLADEAWNIRGVADSLSPIADTLGGYGDQMWESGTKVTEQALATLGTGLGFINMDASASPLVAQALEMFGQIDPNRYVAFAAQDVQKSMDNAQGQMQRNLARQGVNTSGGSAQAQLQKLFQQGLAVAKAAAMTRARERGINDRANALQNLIANNANTFLQTGGQLASIGASAQGQAVGAQKGAADVLGTQGSLYGKAGDIIGNAGQLQGTQGSLFANIAGGRAGLSGIYSSAANLVTGYNKDLQGAYNSLAGIATNVGQNVTGAQNSLANAYNALGNAYDRLGGTILKAANGGSGKLVSTDTGRHYGVGGELLETGDDKVDAQLQMYRDVNGLY